MKEKPIIRIMKLINRTEFQNLTLCNMLKKDYPEMDFLIIKDYSLPLVTCIMPTANRPEFIPNAIKYFLQQDYPFKELVIIDNGSEPISALIPNLYSIRYFYSDQIETLGAKRNRACEKAAGSIIVHFDDDDWYASDWISRQVNILLTTDADICGLNQIQFYSILNNKHWISKTRNCKKLCLAAATLAYRKVYWTKNRFKNQQTYDDQAFARNSNAKLYAHDYYQGFISVIHATNTNIKDFEDPATKIKN